MYAVIVYESLNGVTSLVREIASLDKALRGLGSTVVEVIECEDIASAREIQEDIRSGGYHGV